MNRFRTTATRTRLALACLLTTLAALTGCATNLSGIGGETTFKCKAPDGVQCQSVSGTYANARAGNLPSQQGSPKVDAAGPQANWPAAPLMPAGSDPTTAPVLGAIRSDPTLIRIWIAPWEDADGDLMDQSYVYLAIDTGRWLIEHNRQRIKRRFAPVRAPAGAAAMPAQPVPARAAAPEDEEGAPDGAAALAAGIARLRNGGNRPDAPALGAQP